MSEGIKPKWPIRFSRDKLMLTFPNRGQLRNQSKGNSVMIETEARVTVMETLILRTKMTTGVRVTIMKATRRNAMLKARVKLLISELNEMKKPLKDST
jgi:hypothetical protein